MMAAMSLDRFVDQLPDIDPDETQEWLDSFDAVVEQTGKVRARYLIARLLERAGELQVGNPSTVNTPYVNTIPPEEQPWFPGDSEIERRIRRFIRWNAAVMVIRANNRHDGIGGHLSTFASSASLYEVGFNWFFRGNEDGTPADHVYFQGHAAPGIYARAFLEGRLTEDQLDHFRQEVGGGGLSSYPHPRLMPDFWEFPTVSMGLGPINSIYQARFLKYLHDRRIEDTTGSRVWCYLGDGETDEPETLGSISLAGRAHLDNLTWVVNCNLQRLDGPVRGNGKIIQELEAMFRGAGWNVIKVIWGSRWDELLQRDVDGVLLNKMNTTLDGEYQRYAVEDGGYARERFFGPDPRLRKLVEHLSDDEIRASLAAATTSRSSSPPTRPPPSIRGLPRSSWPRPIKGWTLGKGFEGRNATHQIKKMNQEQLVELRKRLHLEDVISDQALEADDPPFYRPPSDSPEYEYLMNRRQALDGFVPRRTTDARRPLDPAVGRRRSSSWPRGPGAQAVSTTMAFTRLLRDLMRDEQFGPRVVPIVPDEARTFGMDSMFREFKIYASEGQLYEPVDHELLLSYSEGKDGQILEEGITEAGSLASFTAAGTSYATQGVPMVPFYTFYSMFGFQRVGDLIWAAADARARGFLLGATAGRTTLHGEGLQHQDGHSLLLASSVPTCEAYDPAFAYELAILIRDGLHRMYGKGEDVFYYLTLYNENYVMPAAPDGVADGVIEGLYRWREAPAEPATRATLLFSGRRVGLRRRSRPGAGRALGRRPRALERHLVQTPPRGRPLGRTVEPPAPRRRPADPQGHRAARRGAPGPSWRSPTS